MVSISRDPQVFVSLLFYYLILAGCPKTSLRSLCRPLEAVLSFQLVSAAPSELDFLNPPPFLSPKLGSRLSPFPPYVTLPLGVALLFLMRTDFTFFIWRASFGSSFFPPVCGRFTFVFGRRFSPRCERTVSKACFSLAWNGVSRSRPRRPLIRVPLRKGAFSEVPTKCVYSGLV